MSKLRKAKAGMLSAALILLLLILGLSLDTRVAFADYTPPDSWYDWGVGPGGAKLSDESNGFLDVQDVEDAWEAWTSQYVLSQGSSGCGSTTSCIIYIDDAQTLDGTSCYIPDVDDSWYAEIHILAGYGESSLTNYACYSLGSTTYPVFVVSINTEKLGGNWSAARKLHTARHEAGHAFLLNEAQDSTSCWQEWGYWLPLMKHDTVNCSAYPSNYSASYNEALYAVIRNGW